MARKPKNAFESDVRVTASLKRAESDYEYFMKDLFVDSDGDLSATASCGTDVFVCTVPEIPEVIAFLKSVYDAGKK